MATFTTIRILVGPNQVPFLANENLLRSHSDPFDRAFSGQFSESSNRPLFLPEDDPEAFTGLMWWVHTSHFLRDGFKNAPKYSVLQWAKICVLADKYQLTTLHNFVITLMALGFLEYQSEGGDFCEFPIDPELACYIWENTLPSYPLRRLYLEMCTHSRPTTVRDDGQKKWRVVQDLNSDIQSQLHPDMVEALRVCMTRREKKAHRFHWRADFPDFVNQAAYLLRRVQSRVSKMADLGPRWVAFFRNHPGGYAGAVADLQAEPLHLFQLQLDASRQDALWVRDIGNEITRKTGPGRNPLKTILWEYVASRGGRILFTTLPNGNIGPPSDHHQGRQLRKEHTEHYRYNWETHVPDFLPIHIGSRPISAYVDPAKYLRSY